MLLALSLVAALVVTPASAQQAGATTVVLSECSPAVVNGHCRVTIDAGSPSSPLPIKLKRDARVTIAVKKRPFDAMSYEIASKDVVNPDPAAAAFTALLPGLSAFTRSTSTWFDKSSIEAATAKSNSPFWATAARVTAVNPLVTRLKWIEEQQEAAANAMTAAEKALKPIAKNLAEYQGRPAAYWTENRFTGDTADLKKDLTTAMNEPIPAGIIQTLKAEIAAVQKEILSGPTSPPSPDPGVILLLNVVSVQQTEVEADLATLTAARAVFGKALDTVSDVGFTLAAATTYLSPAIGAGPSRHPRSSEITVSAKNVASGATSKLGTVTAVWASSRWETSAGPLFSELRIRSFAAAPKFVNGSPILTSDGKVEQYVAETTSRPMVVPFALIHFNAVEHPVGHTRLAMLVSGGMGVNPHSKSADFALGVSLGYKGFYVSYLRHYARDMRLTGGLVTGQPLPLTTAITTERFWEKSQSLSLTVRVF